MMPVYVDTHCHLNLLPDPRQALDDAPGTVVVAVTELPSQYRLLAAQFRCDHRVRVALGLHPLRAHTVSAFEQGLLIRQLHQTNYVGEIGLDFSKHGHEWQNAQIHIFERLLGEPALGHKVVTVHSRAAEGTVINCLRQANIQAILHWYTGPLRLIDDALSAGMYFSVNPAMIRNRKGNAVIDIVPTERILTETDAPFTRVGARPSRPNDVLSVVSHLASRWHVTAADASRRIHQNLASLYAATVGVPPYHSGIQNAALGRLEADKSVTAQWGLPDDISHED